MKKKDKTTMPSMLSLRFARVLLAGVAACLTASQVPAQPLPPYPVRPVTIVVPYAAGTPEDALTRLSAAKLAERLGQPFNVDNRPTSDPVAVVQEVREAPADGYTLLLATTANFAIAPALDATARVNPVMDFTPIFVLGAVDYLLLASPALKVTDARAAVAAMKAKPGTLRYASLGGTLPATLVTRAFAKAAGVQLQEVAFKDVKQAQAALAAGKVDVMFLDAATALAVAAQSKAIVLGTSAARPFPDRPEIQPLARMVPLTNFDWRSTIGVVARTGTPTEAVRGLSMTLREIEEGDAFREAVGKLGMETLVVQKAEHFGALIASQRNAWGDLAKAAAAAPVAAAPPDVPSKAAVPAKTSAFTKGAAAAKPVTAAK